jgi:lysozyme
MSSLNEHMRLSDAGYKVLREREDLKLVAYLDKAATPHVWTIGLGHTSAAGPPKVVRDMRVTHDEAEEIFRRDAYRFRDEALELVKVSLKQHQFDALCSFLFNVGSRNFSRSTMLKRLNAGDYAGAAEALLWWDKPPEIQSRRRGEHAQFTEGTYIARVT